MRAPTETLEMIFQDSGLGLERGRVELASSTMAWAVAFHRLAALMVPRLPESMVAVEHVGSTAVSGLIAKPILDIAIGVRDAASANAVTKAMEGIGFLYRGDFEGELSRTFGLELEPRIRLVNAHLVEYGGGPWSKYIEFRDRLRLSPTACADYAETKARLAEQHNQDGAASRANYVDGKSEVVARIVT